MRPHEVFTIILLQGTRIFCQHHLVVLPRHFTFPHHTMLHNDKVATGRGWNDTTKVDDECGVLECRTPEKWDVRCVVL